MEHSQSLSEGQKAEIANKFTKLYRIYSIFMNVLNISFVFIIQTIAVIVVLISYDDTSCDQPIGVWLEIWADTNGCLVILYMLSQWNIINKCIRKIIYRLFFIPVGLFSFAWYIVGSVWEFQSDNCYDEFLSGWVLTLIILITFYAVLGLVCCSICWISASMSHQKSDQLLAENLKNEGSRQVRK